MMEKASANTSADLRAARHARKEVGAVYVELLIVFLPVFCFFLLILQFGLLQAGRLGVRHAAATAARAAVVVLDDDPVRYDGQARRSLLSDSCNGDAPGAAVIDFIETITGKTAGSSSGTTTNGQNGAKDSCKGGSRGDAIRTAAIAAMTPFSPALHTLAGAARGGDVVGALGKAMYAMGATSVTFPTSPGATTFSDSFSMGSQVTARVTYLQNCGIPIASRILCDGGVPLFLGVSVPEGGESPTAWFKKQQRLKKAKPKVNEVLGNSAQRLLTLGILAGGRYSVEQAEATLPIQAAPYNYQSGSNAKP